MASTTLRTQPDWQPKIDLSQQPVAQCNQCCSSPVQKPLTGWVSSYFDFHGSDRYMLVHIRGHNIWSCLLQNRPRDTAPSTRDAAAWATAMCRCTWQPNHIIFAFVMLPTRQRLLCSRLRGQVTPAHLVRCRRSSCGHLQVQVSGHPLLPLQGRVCRPPLALASSRLGGILVGQLLQAVKQTNSISARSN